MEQARRVADELAIRNLYAAYTFAVDDHDVEAFANCFTFDAEMELRGFAAWDAAVAAGSTMANANGRSIGREAISALSQMIPPGAKHLHLTSNIQIIQIEGNFAKARAAFCVVAEDGAVEHYGRYQDKLARDDDGRWRFCERIDDCRWERGSRSMFASDKRPEPASGHR